MPHSIRIQSEPFDCGALSGALAALGGTDGAVGAMVTFTGAVRGDGGLNALTLEHYPGMTEKQLTAICNEAEQRWPLSGVLVVHRIGRMAVGENIVFVGVSSAHRKAAFEACDFVMDWLKTKAPFWKKEHWADGRERWVAAKQSDTQAAARWDQGTSA